MSNLEPNDCDCEKSDVEVVQNESNQWYWDCYVICYNCGKATDLFEHRNEQGQLDQNSGTPKAIEAWNKKIFRGPDADTVAINEALSHVDNIDSWVKENCQGYSKENIDAINENMNEIRKKLKKLRDE